MRLPKGFFYCGGGDDIANAGMFLRQYSFFLSGATGGAAGGAGNSGCRTDLVSICGR